MYMKDTNVVSYEITLESDNAVVNCVQMKPIALSFP